MLGSLVAYDSDSGSEQEPSVAAPSSSSGSGLALPPPRASTTTLSQHLPPPKASQPGSASQSGTGSSLSLPPPKQASKRAKFQIKVDSLDKADDNDNDEDHQPDRKKLRPSSGASGSTHSLFGMLPAPKRSDEQVVKEKQAAENKARQGALRIVDENSASSEHDQEGKQEATETDRDDQHSKPKKGKGNADFRAMLGLKPTAPKPAPTSLPSALPSAVAAAKSSSAPPKPPHVTASGSAPKKSAPVDFFSLGDSSSPRTGPAKLPAPERSSSTVTISAAPTIPEPIKKEAPQDTGEYPGWQQDPDGTWVPVTPEAHAQYAAWQAASAAEEQLARAYDDPSRRQRMDGQGFDVGEMVRAGVRQETVAHVDATAFTRPVVDTSLDSRYAAAAADVRAAAAGLPPVSKEDSKVANSRARQRGQLTSLIAQANERKEELEERWAKGKSARQQTSARYGF